jgi:hypothetical protein
MAATIVKLTKNWNSQDNSIVLNVTKFEEIVDIKNIKISLPVTKTNQDENAPYTRMVKLNRTAHTFTLNGYIEAQTGTVKGASTLMTAAQAKNALIFYIIYPSGTTKLFHPGLATLYSSGNAARAGPALALTSLMLDDQANRYAEVEVDKIQFIDNATRQYKSYTTGGGYSYGGTWTSEFSPARYDFVMTLTFGEIR